MRHKGVSQVRLHVPDAAAVLIAAAMILMAGAAFARVEPPVRVTLLGNPRAAVTGATFTGAIRIETGEAASLTDFTLGGDGWQIARLGAPASSALAADRALEIEFAATPGDPDKPLVIAFQWNGHIITQGFDLSAKHLAEVSQPGRVEPVPQRYLTAPAGFDRGWISADPIPASPPESWRDEPGDERGARSRDIRVQGRFVYFRSDNSVIGADGCTVRIMDEDFGVDDELGTGITDSQGYFDITVTWDQIEDDPDLYVEFLARNTQADLQDDTWYITYRWATETREDYEGTSINWGTIWPSDEGDNRALHILTDITRTWRWYHYGGKDCTAVDIFWPDDDEGISYYTPAPWRNIHITTAASWEEDTHSHEYGHHFVDDFGERHDPDYCNPGGFCDNGDDCGHCRWCPENTYITWSEGYAEYSGEVIPGSYLTSYGTAARFLTGVESLDSCGQDGLYHDPALTEGFFGAVLTDIDDSNNEAHGVYPGYSDVLTMGEEEILECVDVHEPMAPMDFLYAFLADNHPVRNALWETCMNSGYDIDRDPPGLVTNLHSPSHTVGEPSPDNTITVHWTAADDEASGISGYAISWTHAPANPGSAQDIDAVTEVTSDALDPGTWYFNIRAHDRAGRWSSSYRSYGGFIIRAPEPADLVHYHRAGWSYEVVPSSASTNTADHCVVSATLPGNTPGTYWNTTGRNTGESATSDQVVGRIYADDVGLSADNYGIVNAGASFMTLNDGPILVRGGRHVFHCEFDPDEHIPETIEWNNDWGHQFIWTPLDLAAGTVVTRTPPGYIMAGFDHVNDGSTLYFNVDGLHMHGSAWWNSVVEWAESNADFYSISLFDPSTGAQNGFDTAVTSSFRPSGRLNALIVNNNQVGQDDWDIGVANWVPEPAAGYRAVYIQNGNALVGTEYTQVFAADAFFALREFIVQSGDVGALSAVVETDPPFTPLHVQWRDEWFTYGDLLDCSAETTTGADGTAHLDFTVSETGYNSLAFWRDPVDGTGPVTVTFRIVRTPPDFEPYFASGWHSPAVPRPADDGTPSSVPLPDTLYGNMERTYYNFALRNDSDGDGADLDVYISLDGNHDAAFHYPTFPAHATSRYNWSAPRVVSGGRHTFSLVIDPDQTVEELSDANNVYGEQYCWSPLILNPGQVQGIAVSPPDRTGGWDEIGSGEPRWYNCTGFRMAEHYGWWTAFAVMPAATGNVDVRLHQALAGVKDGFAQNLAYSGWSTGRSDYVLVNFNLVEPAPYDAGVLEMSGNQWYYTHCAAETYVADNPSGTYGPFSLASGRIINLHEAYLRAGTWTIRLIDDGGNVDFGIGLHPHDEAYQSKSTTVEDGAAWEQPAGTNEEIVVQLTESGYYCLAVWKAVAVDLGDAGSYHLYYEGVTTDVASMDPPSVTGLDQPFPNPSQPGTTFEYRLAASGPVDFSVFNLAGARVCTLVNTRQAPGRHRLLWDGRDDRGRPVAPGVYLARLAAGDVRQVRKVTLIK